MSSITKQRQLRFSQLFRLGTFVGFILSLILILITVENLLLSVVLAFVINYMLGPIVNFMERNGFNRLVSTLIVFTLAGIIVGFGITAVIPLLSRQISLFQDQLPQYINGTAELISEFELWVQERIGTSFQTDFSLDVQQLMVEWTKSLFEDLPTFLSKIGTTLILAPFFAFFLIKDGRGFSKSFLSLVPNHLFELTLNMYYQINEQMGQFVRARLAEALIVAFVVFTGLWTMNFPFASLLALFAGLTNLIPYIGPVIGAIPALLIAMISGDSSIAVAMICVVYGTAQIIDIFFIIPLVVAKLVNLHPVTVVIAIIIGAQLLGILGMIISIPVASALKVIFTNVYKHLSDFRA